MPQTVWDYVAKLKTSVTKASRIYCISFGILPHIIMLRLHQYFTCTFVCFVFVRSYV